MRPVLFIAICVLLTANSYAEPAKNEGLYLGGGVTFNSVGSAGNATGLQILAGYDLDILINNDIRMALEVGYMDTGDFDYYGGGRSKGAEGVWVAAPFRVAISPKVDMLMRVGVDFGDDDGALVGAGLGYNFNKKVALRTEYVVRDNINGLQFNMLFKL